MKFKDLPLNIPVLREDTLTQIEVIRLDDNNYVVRTVPLEDNWTMYTKDQISWTYKIILDQPTDEDAAECGGYPSKDFHSKIEHTLTFSPVHNIFNTECTCDFITQLLPYGCKCGGK